jgi:predicted Zn-dependent protease
MQSLSPDEHRDLSKRLNAAIGYLNLGMAGEAWAELENIDARHRGMLEVLKIRLEVCRAMDKWQLMAEIANHLHMAEPKDPGHPLDLAYAIRRAHGENEAAAVLEDARPKFPEEPLFSYNLACYRAVVGNLTEAKRLLAEAFSMDASLRITALDDPDLVGVWDSFNDPKATSLEEQR